MDSKYFSSGQAFEIYSNHYKNSRVSSTLYKQSPGLTTNRDPSPMQKSNLLNTPSDAQFRSFQRKRSVPQKNAHKDFQIAKKSQSSIRRHVSMIP